MREESDGPIILVDDDKDEHELVESVCMSLGIKNPIITFTNGLDVVQYLKTTVQAPFVILCDINMPRINGLHLRAQLDNDPQLREKAIPFVFLSTIARQSEVNTAYEMTVQGFFEKGYDFETLKTRLKLIFEYWKQCRHPNSFR